MVTSGIKQEQRKTIILYMIVLIECLLVTTHLKEKIVYPTQND